MKEKKPPKPTKSIKLAPEDENLWQIVTQDIKPLPNKTQKILENPRVSSKAKPIPTKITLETLKPSGTQTPTASSFQLDKNLQKKFENGDLHIDGKIDLHGLTLDTAHQKFTRFMHRKIKEGARFLLVVTGKGTGALKRHLPMWCETPEFSRVILQTRTATPEHGGTGATYILLRRKK